MSSSPVEEEYTVEAIRNWRYNYREKQRQFYIKWTNYAEEENTWEPESYLNCPQILKNFLKGLPSKERKYCECVRPEKLNGFQRNATFTGCVGADKSRIDDDKSTNAPENDKIYILCTFEDSDLAEEVTIEEMYEHRPEDLLKFFEARILVKEVKNKK